MVKLGGSLLDQDGPPDALLRALATAWGAGRRLVILHGGGQHIDRALAARGIRRRVHDGLRITDAATLEVVVSVLAGLVNKSLVARLIAAGVKAVGLCGADGGTLMAEFHPRDNGIDYGFVGRIATVDPYPIQALLDARMLPVVASVALGPRGKLLNVNADAAAAALAVALGAQRLVFCTDVEGLLDGNRNLVARIDPQGARSLMACGAVNGGMRPKLNACIEAVSRGVPDVLIAGPSSYQAVLREGMGGTCVVAG
ncbi:MAG: acetylglutamate kinase [Acidobacteria bacterium]|nr:acetylglutamate kinase [Acidobacteriota bacterium]